LKRHPQIARDSIYTAVVCGDMDEVERILAERPEAASEKGGPREWPPLLYLCSTRLSLPAASDNAVTIARALLDRGADPNAYYPGGDQAIHYTALTCVAGEGEEDAPPHPQRTALWKLLLERGAEPYDNQTLYNTHFHGEILWLLELMYAQAVKLGRKADWDDPNWSMLDMGGYGCGARYLLGNAVGKNDLPLAEWILTHGASPDPPPSAHPSASKHTLYEEALFRGHTEMAELLVRYGATPRVVALEGEEAFAAACFRLDRDEARAIVAQHREYLFSTMVIFAATKHDRADVVALLLDLGMSVDVKDAHGTRALHEAAYRDATRVVTLLLERGAEIDPVESNHGKTPLGWAVYGKKQQAIDLLGRVSRDFFQLTWTGNLERLRELLSVEPELAKTVDDGQTPLMWLPDDDARAMEIARLLLANGAEPSIRNNEGKTAADRARERAIPQE
jgi:ankyrin repeat protein